MELKVLTGKDEIYAYLSKNAASQIYCIGDLDDFFFPHTAWYALAEGHDIKSVALLYSAMAVPTLLLFHENNDGYGQRLMQVLKPALPPVFYAHLSPGLADVLGREHIAEHYGVNYKMTLKELPPVAPDGSIRRLAPDDMHTAEDFYRVAYPHNWFDKRMLETGKYYGYMLDDALAGIAGVHVYSAQYRVAALGNVAVHPDFRGKQIGLKLTLALCSDLLETTDIIGLNVRSNNLTAIRMYQKAGFEVTGEYEECLVKLN